VQNMWCSCLTLSLDIAIDSVSEVPSNKDFKDINVDADKTHYVNFRENQRKSEKSIDRVIYQPT
jgi:hypothetical protein